MDLSLILNDPQDQSPDTPATDFQGLICTPVTTGTSIATSHVDNNNDVEGNVSGRVKKRRPPAKVREFQTLTDAMQAAKSWIEEEEIRMRHEWRKDIPLGVPAVSQSNTSVQVHINPAVFKTNPDGTCGNRPHSMVQAAVLRYTCVCKPKPKEGKSVMSRNAQLTAILHPTVRS